MTVGDGKTASAGSAGSGNGKKNAMPAHETRRRVKLYALNAEKQWDDKGTGHVSSSYVERLKGYSLLVRAEVDGSILLESKILPDTTYQKQQETLIVWSEGENYDLALSFQERAGCDEIWEKICQVQGKDPSVDTTQDVVDESEDERFSEDNDVGSSAENTFNLGVVELPGPEISKLEEIDEVIQSSLSAPVRREKLALVLESDEYLRKLMGIFRQCEDIEDIASLHHLYRIVRNIFLMNKTTLIELLLQDDVVFDVIGCLEYDPAQKSNRRKHRQFLQSQANFRQVVPSTNKDLNAKIHQTYRAQYLHDVALPAPSFFEDNTSTLSSFIFFNKVDIVSMIQKDEHFLNEVFSSLTDENTEPSKRRDLVFFLKELCTFSQTLQPANREGFMKSLSSMGILSALEIALCIENQPSVRNAAVDILHLVVEFSPSMIREHMLQQVGNVEEEQLLSNVLLDAMMCDSDPDLTGAMQLQGIFKIILDPENMLAATNKSEKSDFLTYFYKHSMHVLTAPLLAHTADGKPAKDDYQSATLLSLIVEVLAFCVDHHTFHVKNYIIGKDLLRRVLVLLKSAHKSLALCALRLMRKILNLKDTFYNTHIMEKGLFEPVINCLIDNNRRYNLLDSAILEMFEFVKGEVPTLYAHIVDRYGKRLEAIDYVPTFRDISKKKKQAENDERSPARGPRDPRFESKNINRFRRDPREPEEDETLWFDTEDDDDEDPTPSTGPNPASLLASVATPVVSSFLPVSLGAANGGSPSLTSLSPTATSPIPSLVSSPLAALTSSAIGSVVSGLGSVSPLLSAAAAASSAFANLAAGSALSAVAELTEQGLVKGSLLAKRGLVDYEGDSDEEENERDDGDADCEDEDEDEEDKNAANSSVLDTTLTPTSVTMMVNGHEEKDSNVEEQPEEAKKAENSEERLKGEEKEEANVTDEPNKVEEKPRSSSPDKTEQEEPDSPEPHAPSPRKRSREMAMESGGDSESSSPKNGEPEIDLDVIDGESRDGLPAEIAEQEESVETDAKRPRVE